METEKVTEKVVFRVGEQALEGEDVFSRHGGAGGRP